MKISFFERHGELHMTQGEQNLLLLESSIPANEKFYVWCYGDDGHLIASSCPEAEQTVLDQAFRMFGGIKKMQSYAASQETRPLLIGSPIGMQWAICCETERKRSLLFVMGPVFYSPPIESQLRQALRPYRNSLEEGRWASSLLQNLQEIPTLPYAIFTRYVTMVYNALTGEQQDVSILLGDSSGSVNEVQAAEKRDRSKIYLAERAMLQMVRNGDINYQNVFNLSSSMSPGVPVKGRDPLQQTRISIIVFTSLVCRAAMEGGLSPELAYPLGDSYIEAVVNSNDTGELTALALTMYHDFIYRVHHLRTNPNYSHAIQKCCDYIELGLNRKIRISDLATLCGYTEYYLTEKFKNETGQSITSYIRFAKIERAKVLLVSTDEEVREIAEKLAFNTPNYFIQCFRETTGYTPTQYRKKFRKP